MNIISLQYLDECFYCDANSGKLYWKVRPEKHFETKRAQAVFNAKLSGKLAGCKRKKQPYMQVRFAGKCHCVHRIIYAMHNGHWPFGVIRHIDGDYLNNRIGNLKDSPQNEWRRKPRDGEDNG